MNRGGLVGGVAIVVVLGSASVHTGHAQESPAIDLQGWRDALGGRAGVTIKTYPTLNHLFLPGEGKSTPSEYERAGHIPDFVLDDIANGINTISKT